MSRLKLELEFDTYSPQVMVIGNVSITYTASSACNFGPASTTVFWIETPPKLRRTGLAKRALRAFREALESSVCGPVVVYAVLTSKISYRLFRKVFGRPVRLIREPGEVTISETEAVKYLPSRIPFTHVKMVESVFALRKRELVF